MYSPPTFPPSLLPASPITPGSSWTFNIGIWSSRLSLKLHKQTIRVVITLAAGYEHMNIPFYMSSSSPEYRASWSSFMPNANTCFLFSRPVWTKWPKDTCSLMWWPLLVRNWLPSKTARKTNKLFFEAAVPDVFLSFVQGHRTSCLARLTVNVMLLTRGRTEVTLSPPQNLFVGFSSCSPFNVVSLLKDYSTSTHSCTMSKLT